MQNSPRIFSHDFHSTLYQILEKSKAAFSYLWHNSVEILSKAQSYAELFQNAKQISYKILYSILVRAKQVQMTQYCIKFSQNPRCNALLQVSLLIFLKKLFSFTDFCSISRKLISFCTIKNVSRRQILFLKLHLRV